MLYFCAFFSFFWQRNGAEGNRKVIGKEMNDILSDQKMAQFSIVVHRIACGQVVSQLYLFWRFVLFCFATEYSHNQYSDAVYGKCVCNVCTFNVATHGTQGQSKRKIYSFASCRLRLDNVVWLHWRKATRIRTCEIAKP